MGKVAPFPRARRWHVRPRVLRASPFGRSRWQPLRRVDPPHEGAGRMVVVTDDVHLRVAQALAAAERGSPGATHSSSVWDALDPDEQARYRMLARSAVEEYLVAIADART